METISTNPKEDLQTIRDIMERSSKFLSLSGLAGIFAGLCALTGAAIAWVFIFDSGNVTFEEFAGGSDGQLAFATRLNLALDALLVLGFAFTGTILFSQRKARRAGQKFWTISTKRIFVHLLIPLMAGGLFIMILVSGNHWELIAPVMLIFYGLSLVNAGKFTFSEIHYLGLTEIVLGVLAGFLVNFGLIFWTVGFGLMHVLYGTVMYLRYEHQK